MTRKLTERQLRLLRNVKSAQARPVYAALGGPYDTSKSVFYEWDSYSTYYLAIESAIAERLRERGYLKRTSVWPIFRTNPPLRRMRLGWVENRRVHVKPRLGNGGKWQLTDKGMRMVQL